MSKGSSFAYQPRHVVIDIRSISDRAVALVLFDDQKDMGRSRNRLSSGQNAPYDTRKREIPKAVNHNGFLSGGSEAEFYTEIRWKPNRNVTDVTGVETVLPHRLYGCSQPRQGEMRSRPALVRN